jgi:hypothetical protein
MSPVSDGLSEALRVAYSSAIQAVDSAREELLVLEAALDAAIARLEDHLTRGLDDLRHGGPRSGRDLRDFGETAERLAGEIRDAQDDLRNRVESLSGRGCLDEVSTVMVDLRTGEFSELQPAQ